MEVDFTSQTIPVAESVLKNAIPYFSNIMLDSRIADNPEAHIDLIWYRSMLDTLVETCASAGLRPSHRAAACNALCCYINLLCASSRQQLQDIAYAEGVDLTLLSIYLERFDNAKSRAMKQLLSTTLGLTQRRCKLQLGLSPLNAVATRLLNIVLIEKDNVKIKPALSALNTILGKRFLTFNHVLELYVRYSPSEEVPLSTLEQQQKFLEEVFAWVVFPEVASLVGQIAATVVAILAGEEPENLRLLGGLPVWASPLCATFEKNNGQNDVFTAYLIPHLLITEKSQVWKFLKCLKIDEYFQIELDGAKVEDADLCLDYETRSSLLFACLQVGKEIGVIEESGNTTVATVSDDMIWLPDEDLGKLLSHSTRSVRFSTLRILVASRFSSKPLNLKAILSLKEHLPHMLADSDTKFRSEVLNTVKTLLDRVRNAAANLNKKIKDFEKKRPLSTTNTNGVAETGEIYPYHFLSQFNEQRRLLKWLVELPKFELHSGASYQRHFSALKVLQLLTASGIDNLVPSHYLSKTASGEVRWPFHFEVVDEALSRLLFDLLLDPYDDVRHASLKILKIYRPCIPRNPSSTINFDEIKKRKESADYVGATAWERDLMNPWPIVVRATSNMMKSGRVDSADGMARLYDLASTESLALANVVRTPEDLEMVNLRQKPAPKLTGEILGDLVSAIEESLTLSKSDLSQAVESHPIHGFYLALRYVVENMNENLLSSSETNVISVKIDLAQSTLFQVWDLIRDTLCNDAPEGFLPEDVDEEDEFTTKDLLSFCWRSLKESSLFVRSLISKCRGTSVKFSSLASLGLEALGILCFEQLAELRHPGAISTVAQTFTTICQKSRQSTDPAEQGLRNILYSRTLDLIKVKGGVYTRRSAGLPAIVIALLSADADDAFFDQVMADLKGISSAHSSSFSGPSGTDLPQVHAMNSLRAIFTAAGLGTQAERHIVSTMRIAANTIQSEIWAIRNCSLMLFRSLTDRLLGSHEAFEDVATSYVRPSSKLSYSHYPGLLDIIIDLLASGQRQLSETSVSAENRLEALFPSLDLIRRSRVPREARSVLQPRVLAAATNQHWHVRELAAQAYASIAIEDSVDQHVHLLLQQPLETQNKIHGTLLCVKYMVRSRNYLISEEEGRSILSDIQIYHAKGSLSSHNPVNLITFIDVLCEMAQVVIRHRRKPPELTLPTAHGLVERFLAVSQLASQDLESYLETKICLEGVELVRDNLVAYMKALGPDVDDYDSWQASLGESYRSLADLEVSVGYLSNLGRLIKKNDYSALFSWFEEFERLQEQPCSVQNWEKLYPLLVDFSIRMMKLGVWTGLTRIHNKIRKLVFTRPTVGSQSPSKVENSLCIWALVINANLQHIYTSHTRWLPEQESLDTLKEVGTWIRTVRYFLTESNHFSTRYAALTSVMVVCNTSHQLLKHESVEADILLAIYDSLNDDDEEIRELAASIICTLIPQATRRHTSTEYAVVPRVSSSRLFKYILKHHKLSPLICREAIRRITSLHSAPETCFTSFLDVLKDAEDTQGDLFKVERQNLYVDSIEETAKWAGLLSHASSASITKRNQRKFVGWISQSLDIILAETAKRCDGPLGWTSNQNIFVFGMQVLFATEVALTWRDRFLGLQSKGWQLQLKLAKLVITGENSRLHPLWLRKADGILRRIIRQRVLRVGQMVRSCDALTG